MNRRDLARTHRLLRRLDLTEVLGDLGLEVLRRVGADAYVPCPDPGHSDRNPSCHVCVEDVPGRDGTSLLGSFNCWSHPGDDGLRGLDFLDLVARVRGDVWDRWPTRAERDAAAAWLRREYLRDSDPDAASQRVQDRRRAAFTPAPVPVLRWPPNLPVAGSVDGMAYLRGRDLGLARAVELGVRFVRSPGPELRGALSRTCPGVLFPIRGADGRVVNWFLRSIHRVPSRDKGRYCPGVPLASAGVIWAPGPLDLERPVALVEGVFDAERVRALILRSPGASAVLPGNVVAVLGGRIHPAQAARLRAVPLLLHLSDGDAGGEALGASVGEHLSRWTRVISRQMPAGTDPGDAPGDAVLEALSLPDARRLLRVRARTRIRR